MMVQMLMGEISYIIKLQHTKTENHFTFVKRPIWISFINKFAFRSLSEKVSLSLLAELSKQSALKHLGLSP